MTSARGRRALAFRALQWTMLIYICIASLHGLVPGIWGRLTDDGPEAGPFRVLLFTLVVLALAIILTARERVLPAVAACATPAPPHRLCWSPRQLRAPPSSS